MIKAVASSRIDGAPVLILGLTEENITRLIAGKPISVATHTMGATLPALHIVLVAGTDQAALVRQFGPLVDDQTKIRDERSDHAGQ